MSISIVNRKSISLVCAFALTLSGCNQSFVEAEPAPTRPAIVNEQSTPTSNAEQADDDAGHEDDEFIEEGDPQWVDFETEVLATDLDIPWELVFLPDGDILITERPGMLRVFRDGELLEDALFEFEDVVHERGGEGGLLGMTLHPDFEHNGWIYFYYTYRDEDTGELLNRLVRYVLADEQLNEKTILLDDLPGAFTHNGGRIMFGPDDKLYVTLGDAQRQADAQDPDVLVGKILRINDDGTYPEDNPFEDSPVYALGFRNPQGIAWHPETGELYAAQHGPTGNDEVNLVLPGANYGWPDMEGFEGDYDSDFTLPVLASGRDTWAPSGAVFVEGDLLPQWQNEFLMAGLRSVTLYRINFEGDETEMGPIIQGDFGRLRTVVEGPDGYIYLLTSNRDERQDPADDDDKLIRLVPAE